MNIETLRAYCLSKNNVTEEFPFSEDVLVFKVNGKFFLLVPLTSEPLQFNAKCAPYKAAELRERYHAVQPGYHMNKKHWNTVVIDGSIPQKLLKEMIDDSYNLVSKSASRK